MAPKEAYVPVPGTCKYVVTLRGRRDFADGYVKGPKGLLSRACR